MVERKDRRDREVWDELVDAAGEAEIERAASVSVAQAERELAAAGFDVAAERAKSEAFLAELEGGASAPVQAVAAPPGVPELRERRERRRPRPVLLWLAAAATATAAGGGLLYATLHHAGPEAPSPRLPSPPAPPTAPSAPTTLDAGPPLVAASDLRRDAVGACAARRWYDCLHDLDRAREMDPAGDAAPAVRALRAEALGHLSDKPKP